MSCEEKQVPAKGDQNQRSPQKLPPAAGNLSPQRRRKQNNSRKGEDAIAAATRESKPRIRVDKRLEAQRLLTQSIRKKLLRGVFGAKSDGFLGVQDTLFNLDQDGEGFLDERVFTEQFLPRLKSLLTQSETEFLLMNIRMRGGGNNEKDGDQQQQQHGNTISFKKHKRHYRIDYEQMGVICNLDSDVSLSSDSESAEEEDDKAFSAGTAAGDKGSPTKNRKNSSSNNLGADFLAAEKRLQSFLSQQEPQLDSNHGDSTKDTPRSALTGAEHFLEHAELIDSTRSGFLREQGLFYEQLLNLRSQAL